MSTRSQGPLLSVPGNEVEGMSVIQATELAHDSWRTAGGFAGEQPLDWAGRKSEKPGETAFATRSLPLCAPSSLNGTFVRQAGWWHTGKPTHGRHGIVAALTTLPSQYLTHEHSHITRSVAAMDSPGDVDAFIYELPSPCLASLDTVTTVSSSYSSIKGLSSLREKGTDQARSFSQNA